MSDSLGQIDDDARRIAAALLEGYSGNVERTLMLTTLIRAELMRSKNKRPTAKLSVSKT